MMYPKIPVDEWPDVKKKYLAGDSVAAIAADYPGATGAMVYHVLHRLDVEMRRPGRPNFVPPQPPVSSKLTTKPLASVKESMPYVPPPQGANGSGRQRRMPVKGFVFEPKGI